MSVFEQHTFKLGLIMTDEAASEGKISDAMRISMAITWSDGFKAGCDPKVNPEEMAEAAIAGFFKMHGKIYDSLLDRFAPNKSRAHLPRLFGPEPIL